MNLFYLFIFSINFSVCLWTVYKTEKKLWFLCHFWFYSYIYQVLILLWKLMIFVSHVDAKNKFQCVKFGAKKRMNKSIYIIQKQTCKTIWTKVISSWSGYLINVLRQKIVFFFFEFLWLILSHKHYTKQMIDKSVI